VRRALLAGWTCLTAIGVACTRDPPPRVAPPPSAPRAAERAPEMHAVDAASDAVGTVSDDASAPIAAAIDAASDVVVHEDPMTSHLTTAPELARLVLFPHTTPARAASRDGMLPYLVAPMPGRFNHGNRALAHHKISRAACLAGLRDVVLQTDEQRAICKGEANMVPIYADGDPRSARACIDVFEFPNQPCELPFVWGSPSQAETLCEMQGKRLCAQPEWNQACSGDPAGKERWPYAYGRSLDLTVCNTNTPHWQSNEGRPACNVHDAQAAWSTCATDTEPAGAFPRCRSRLGVFDQHGNVAEEMTRTEAGETLTQLKGSAFFYVDTAVEPGKPSPHPGIEAYPDTCEFDPRWHVEKLREAVHVNYHLGFRCCKTVGGR
jgi:hypothetical protein